VEHRRLAAQLCGIFVTVEKSDFENRLPKVLSLILQQFSSNFNDDNQPGRFVRIAQPNDDNPPEREKREMMGDHLLFQVLQLLLKICTFHPNILTDSKWEEDMEAVAGILSVFLHPPQKSRDACGSTVEAPCYNLGGHRFRSQKDN
jgi:U3 small nucleolar RNA-associated protein 20